MVVAVVTALVASALVAAPAGALSADAMVDDTAPGAVGDYRVTITPEEGDAITRNGLQSVTLDFGADRDYSGDLGNLTARDVEVRVGDENGTAPAGETSVNRSGSEVTITLEQAFENVSAGDRIVVRLSDVTNTEIAIPNPQGLRGFALDVSATGPQGNTDGPVEARYTIDPNATAQQTPTPAANDSETSTSNSTDAETGTDATGTDGNDTESNDTATEAGTDSTETDTGTDAATGTETGTVTATAAESDTPSTSTAAATDTAAAVTAIVQTLEPTTTEGTTSADTTTRTTDATPTEATETAEPAEPTEPAGTSPTEEPTEPAATNQNESGGQATDTTGPGFGLLVALVALLAAGLLATRRRD